MICYFFKCSLDSDILHAILMLYFLLSPATLNSHLRKAQFPGEQQIRKLSLPAADSEDGSWSLLADQLRLAFPQRLLAPQLAALLPASAPAAC